MLTEQVKLQLPHLKAGGTYLFDHISKGPFVGIFRGLTGSLCMVCGSRVASDSVESPFIHVDVYTEDGSGQERLANAFVRDELGRKMRPVYTPKHIALEKVRAMAAPSATVRAQMKARFDDQRAKAVPVLSIPTEQVMARLETAPEPEAPKKSLLSKLLRR